MATFPSVEDHRLIEIGKQYGAYVYASGTVPQLQAARDLGRQIEARLQAVGGSLSWTLEQLEQAERPNAVPQMPDISVNNISDKSASVNWIPYQYDKPTVTGFHFVLKDQDTGQTLTEINLMSGARNSYVTNLESGTNYKGYLIAVNAIGNSPENSISFKTLGTVLPPEPEPPTFDFIIEPDGKVRMIRLTGIPSTEYEIKVFPDSVQDFIDRSIARLLTSAERAAPPLEPEPEPEPTFCVNAYNIRDSGDVYAVSYLSVTAAKVEELKLTQFVLSCDSPTLPTNKEVQDFYGFIPLPPVIDTTINSTMVSQSIGSFVLKDGIVKGEILYIANQSFNPFYYGKNLTSLVQIKSKSGVVVTIKPNVLNFTETERDETITIDQGAGNFKELLIDFFVWDSPTSQLIFAESKQIQIVDETDIPPVDPIDPKPPTTCQSGYHKDFSGKCVPDDPVGEIPRDKLIDTLKGFLFGTVALSLLARKY